MHVFLFRSPNFYRKVFFLLILHAVNISLTATCDNEIYAYLKNIYFQGLIGKIIYKWYSTGINGLIIDCHSTYHSSGPHSSFSQDYASTRLYPESLLMFLPSWWASSFSRQRGLRQDRAPRSVINLSSSARVHVHNSTHSSGIRVAADPLDWNYSFRNNSTQRSSSIPQEYTRTFHDTWNCFLLKIYRLILVRRWMLDLEFLCCLRSFVYFLT